MRRSPHLRLAALTAAFSLGLAACTTGGDIDLGSDDGNDCTKVDVAASPEKVDLLTALAGEFNDSDDADVGGKCARVRIARKSSGAAATALAEGWDEAVEGERPVIWSPASSAWGAVLNQRLGDKKQAAIAPPNPVPFMVTPLVIAMPRPMATALGWPATPIGFSDLLALAQDPQGWAGKGHPEWGAFKLGKTNPNFSTSALSATVAQYYAAVGKTRDLSLEDLDRPDVAAFTKGVESAVVHYGDITNTFLDNWYRNDTRGTALTYVSAAAVEEKSVIDYNRGNPDGILQPGERPKPPRVPLVAIYPKDGTLFSDNPFFVLNASWVSPAQKAAAAKFTTYVQRPAAQRRVLQFGFRPGNPAVRVASPIVSANGVDPKQPQTTLEVPTPPVLVRVIDKWAEGRKRARVLIVIDVSGSMGEDAGNGSTKLDLAQKASVAALDEFQPDDEIGLRIFSTNLRNEEPRDYIDLVPIGAVAQNREVIARNIRSLIPREGTPLYTVAKSSYEEVKAKYDPTRINAVLLLTDGENEDVRNNDLPGLLRTLRAGSEGSSSSPVRVFTIAYGKGARQDVLRQIAQSTNAAPYDASDPLTISKVFTAVVSNF